MIIAKTKRIMRTAICLMILILLSFTIVAALIIGLDWIIGMIYYIM